MSQSSRTVEGFFNYDLQPGDRVKILKGSMCQVCEPDWVEVVKEYPRFILFKFYYKHWTGELKFYHKCINKVSLLSADASFQKE